jgi:aspartyl-tRNA(Asn)/glutamyl-tRNA(Gln) amidotransferase subunit A
VTSPAAASTPGVVDAAQAIADGRLDPEALVAACLERIEHAEPRLNAFRWVLGDRALEEAAAAGEAVQRGAPLGPLHGVPIAVKDNIAVAGDPLTAATPQLEGCVADEDSEVVARLRRAGAIVLGRAHMSTWAIGGTSQNAYYGPVANAWDPERVAGGSSGGSAVAVAAGMVPAALGSDTGGSVRIPACLNGLSGLRSTVGRVSNTGTIPVAWSFDVVGPIARTALDVARVLGVIAGFDRRDPVCADRPTGDYEGELDRGVDGLRVVRLGGYFRDRAEPPVEAALDAAAQALESIGATVEEAELPGIEEAVEWTADLLLAEAAAYHADRLRDDPDGFQADVRLRLEHGAKVSGPHYATGRREQRRWRRLMLEALDGRDVLLAPACPIEAPRIADSDPVQTTAELAACLTPFVLVQLPALTVPCGFGPHGLPLGLQLVGRPFAEATLLRVAHAYQQVTDWHLRRPPLV